MIEEEYKGLTIRVDTYIDDFGKKHFSWMILALKINPKFYWLGKKHLLEEIPKFEMVPIISDFRTVDGDILKSEKHAINDAKKNIDMLEKAFLNDMSDPYTRHLKMEIKKTLTHFL